MCAAGRGVQRQRMQRGEVKAERRKRKTWCKKIPWYGFRREV